MNSKILPDNQLIKRHNEGEIFLLEHNSTTDDRFLISLETTKHLYKNEKGDKYFLCEFTSNEDSDFGIIGDGIEELEENETFQHKVFLPDCIIDLNVIEEFTEEKMIDHLMYEVLDNLALVKELTGANVSELIEKFKKKTVDPRLKYL